jgi:AcrR family transcriptional regulator
MRRRAEQVDQTRHRIVEAAVHLHGTVGPAATTIAGIAEQAGVTRLTVYRHFPDEETLFAACSAHWLSQQVQPDPDSWARIADPAERLRVGLADLYRYYRQGEPMLTQIYRDKAAMPEPNRRMLDTADGHLRDVLLRPFGAAGARRRELRAVLGHAASFSTWRSLCVEHGLPDREAVDVMAALVLTTAARPARAARPPARPLDAAKQQP